MTATTRVVPKMLTAAEAAELLRLRESTLRDYARRGVIPSVKIGRHVRFIQDDLIDHLDSLRSTDKRAAASW